MFQMVRVRCRSQFCAGTPPWSLAVSSLRVRCFLLESQARSFFLIIALRIGRQPFCFLMALCWCHVAMAGCWVFRSVHSNHNLTVAHASTHSIVHSCMSHKCSMACVRTRTIARGMTYGIHARAAQDRLDTRKIS